MNERLIGLTSDLIKMNTVSSQSNKDFISLFKTKLIDSNFEIEEINYKDSNGVEKYNIVARRGSKKGGLAFLIHSDCVPVFENSQLIPIIKDNKIYGRGACDMKGPAAASLLAVIDSTNIKMPITFIITSDEEIGCVGAEHIAKKSELLKKYPPTWGIATEPTELKPVFAHKGLCNIIVTAHGKAAHSSTSIGDNANFKMIPFLTFISKIKEKYNVDESYQNKEFNPPTNTLNLTLSDFNCAPNVTAEKSRCKICFRAMPHARTEEIITEIKNEAEKLGLDFDSILLNSIHTDKGNEFVQIAHGITNNKPETVAYLTDASMFQSILKPIILGPGSIQQAHTKDEYIDIDELNKGYEIYKKMIIELDRIFE